MAIAAVHGSVAGANDRKKKSKVEKTMGEFKRGTLHSGSKHGPKVRKRSQAIAIGLSKARKAGSRHNPRVRSD